MEETNFLQTIEPLSGTTLIAFLMNKRLIHDKIECVHCLVEMILKPDSSMDLGYRWQCMNKQCDFYQTKRSLLTHSFFNASNIPVKKQLKIIYYLTKKCKYEDIAEHVGGDVSRQAIGNIKKKLFIFVNKYFEENPVRLGGPGVVVQVDETKLNFNVKSHRGKSTPADWALTMADTSSIPSKSYATMVPNRSANTMVPMIQQVVRSQSIIHSDEWAAYKSINNDPNLTHGTINHKLHFVDPRTGIHTQHVESLNNKIKLDVKAQKGVRKTHRPRFLNFFMFIDHHKKNAIFKMLKILRI